MLNIELIKLTKMSPSGSGAIAMIQNNSLPSLDLLVRESIQNCLDAKDPGIDKDTPVIVNILHGKFDSKKLNPNFEEIDESLNKISNTKNNNYIAIRDLNTTGLIGDIDGKKTGPNQNFNNLVYFIMKAQSQQGAGGSWGLGKTVYFRLGIGLVIYYSRIKTKNGYEERLAASLLEDETKGGLLDLYGEDNNGIAFFGNKKPDGSIEASKDPKKIEEILECFNIDRYKENETGTTVIIPYIDDSKVLSENKVFEKNFWWETSVEHYIKMAILRWYFPRMSKKYPYDSKLFPLVNHAPININDREYFVFRSLMNLYDACYSKEEIEGVKKIDIERNGLNQKEIGTLCYTEIDQELVTQNGLPNPYECALYNYENLDANSPFICYTRRPGMVVKYYAFDHLSLPKDKYVLGIFTLNSNNSFKNEDGLNLDEYVRRGEKADHADWFDYTVPGLKHSFKIISRINNSIKNSFNSDFGKTKILREDSKIESTFSRLFARLLLPENNFGHHRGDVDGNEPPKKRKTRKIRNSFSLIKTSFENNELLLQYDVNIVKSVKDITIKTAVNTIGKTLGVDDYDELGMNFPYFIDKVDFRISMLNKEQVFENFELVKGNRAINNKYYNIKVLTNDKNRINGFILEQKSNFSSMNFSLNIKLKTDDKNICPNLLMSFGDNYE